MTTRQCDKLIKSGRPCKLYDKHFRQEFTATIVGRDRWNIHTADGGVICRGDLEFVGYADVKKI